MGFIKGEFKLRSSRAISARNYNGLSGESGNLSKSTSNPYKQQNNPSHPHY